MSTIARMDVRLGLDGSDFDRGIARAQASAESLGKKLGSMGTTMSLAVTAPLMGIAGMAVKSAGDFEQSMNIMGQVTGATGEQMAALQQQALSLGATTSFSAGEAAAAMLELGKAGLEPGEIMGAIAGTMDMAAAGNMELATAATIAANAMNAFQLPATEVANVSNMLAAAANASSADIDDLAAGMQMAGAVFASNGQSVSDLATGMAILANNGIAGSDAGTSLKTMLMRLNAPTGEAADAIKSLGIQVYNADGSMRDFGSIIGSLEAATAGMTDQQRNMALTTIFGADAIRAATILAGEGADGFADMARAVGKQGAAAATAGARMKGIGGAVEYLKGSIDSFLITAALPFLDSLSGIVRSAADLLTMVGELPAPVRNVALAFAGVLAATGPVLLIVSKLVPVFGMIGAVLGALASPIGLVVLAVAALGAAWATNFGGIRDVTMSVLGPVLGGLDSLSKYVGAVLEDGDTLNDWLTHLPESIQPAVQKFGEMVAELKKWIDLAMSGDFSGLWTEMGAALTSVQVAVSTFDWGNYIAAIDWGGYIQALSDWGTYVAVLTWQDYIQPLVWDGWLAKLDWEAIGLTAVDWAMWIPALLWTMFISPVRWVSWIAALAWNTIIDPLAWNKFIPTMASWSEFLSKLDWNTVFNPVAWGLYISTLDWGSFLPVKFAWSKFIERVSWFNHIPVFSWPTFNAPDWSSFVAKLEWPKIPDVDWGEFVPDLEWPKIPKIDWGEFIPDIEWPSIPSFPGWVDILRALGFGQSIPTGGNSGSTGSGAVGQTSSPTTTPTTGYPVDVTAPYPQTTEQDVLGSSSMFGSSAYPTDFGGLDGMGALAAAGVTLGPVNIYNQVDVQALAWQVAQLLGRRR